MEITTEMQLKAGKSKIKECQSGDKGASCGRRCSEFKPLLCRNLKVLQL